MSKEKHINEITNELIFTKNYGTLDAVAKHLYESGYRKQEWISVDDRFPENDYEKHWKERQRYLVYTEPNGLMYVAKYGYKEYGWWSDGSGYVLDERNYRNVTHWMPLPEPPKMKGGAE